MTAPIPLPGPDLTDGIHALFTATTTRLHLGDLARRHGAEVTRVDGWAQVTVDGVTWRAPWTTPADHRLADEAADRWFAERGASDVGLALFGLIISGGFLLAVARLAEVLQ